MQGKTNETNEHVPLFPLWGKVCRSPADAGLLSKTLKWEIWATKKKSIRCKESTVNGESRGQKKYFWHETRPNVPYHDMSWN